MYYMLPLEKYFNNVGITEKENVSCGELTPMGTSLPKEGPFEKEIFYYKTVPFKLKKSKNKDNIFLDNQKIDVNLKKIKKIYFVGNAFNGNLTTNVQVYDEFNNKSYFKIKLTDFKSQTPFFNNDLLYEFSGIHNDFSRFKGKLWVHELILEKQQNIKKIILGDNAFIHIFAITLEGAKKWN